MFDECLELIEKAFNNYKMIKLFASGNISETTIVNDKKSQIIPVILKDDILYPLTKKEILIIKGKIIFNNNLTAPISTNDEIGELKIYLENNLIFSQKLYTINVEKYKEKNLFKKIIKRFW